MVAVRRSTRCGWYECPDPAESAEPGCAEARRSRRNLGDQGFGRRWAGMDGIVRPFAGGHGTGLLANSNIPLSDSGAIARSSSSRIDARTNPAPNQPPSREGRPAVPAGEKQLAWQETRGRAAVYIVLASRDTYLAGDPRHARSAARRSFPRGGVSIARRGGSSAVFSESGRALLARSASPCRHRPRFHPGPLGRGPRAGSGPIRVCREGRRGRWRACTGRERPLVMISADSSNPAMRPERAARLKLHRRHQPQPPQQETAGAHLVYRADLVLAHRYRLIAHFGIRGDVHHRASSRRAARRRAHRGGKAWWRGPASWWRLGVPRAPRRGRHRGIA
jgi:hypothetical protein